MKFPLHVLNVITGVSGSGKSSLIKGVLYPAIKRHLDEVAEAPGEYISLDGDWEQIKHAEFVDQNPIGKVPVQSCYVCKSFMMPYANCLQTNLCPNRWDFQHSSSLLMQKVEDVKNAKVPVSLPWRCSLWLT